MKGQRMTDVNCTTENRGMFGKDTVVDPTSHKEFHGISDTLTRTQWAGKQACKWIGGIFLALSSGTIWLEKLLSI